MGMRKSPFKKNTLILLLTAAAIVICALILANDAYLNESEIIMGDVFINGVPVSGLTVTEARILFHEFNDELESGFINIRADDTEKMIKPAEIGLKYDIEKALATAYDIGRKGNYFTRLKEKGEKKYLYAEWIFDEEKAKNIIRGIAGAVFKEPVSASVSIGKTGGIALNPSSDGRVVDIERSIDSVRDSLGTLLNSRWDLIIEKIPPAVSTEDAEAWKINGVIASYITKFSESVVNRAVNVHLAAEALDNATVWPDEEFSFNETVGPRTTTGGYRKAKIIKGDEFVDGIGGGVCQVSSTLYNAVLEAGFEVTERFPHSLPVDYVPTGKDATVSYGFIDFKFINRSNSPIIIHTECNNGRLVVALYGNTTGK